MASDYEAIRAENIKRYGTEIGRIGKELLADRYDDRTHFIYELLQNSEDAIGKRGALKGPGTVKFILSKSHLSVSHYGKPFDEADVRGICGIAESTKDATAIGRFGIGFKSVYTFTDRPEVHSGGEDFSIENYVQPLPATRKDRHPDETLIVMPLKADDEDAIDEITDGFRRLGANSLLFLRNIEEIEWQVNNGPSGNYIRSAHQQLDVHVRRVMVIGQETDSGNEDPDEHPDVDAEWLIFEREVLSPDNKKIGFVEIAFSLTHAKDQPREWRIVPVTNSPLVVYFPTVVSTNLGFLLQGPFRTTPSRDNIPAKDPWNRGLIKETADLLLEALRWLRDHGQLDVSALGCLPLERSNFPEDSMFAPIFDAVKQALENEPLLPGFDTPYISAAQAVLARTKELRRLFSGEQLAELLEQETAAWLSDDITQDRTPGLRQYLMRELGIQEMTPATIVPLLNAEFLEAQPDEWILQLYEFLNGQEATVRRRLDTLPLIRLRDGSHVTAEDDDGRPNAFLPGEIQTDFPMVKAEVCCSAEALAFVQSLGITAPDAIDDVVRNILPKYSQDEVDVTDEEYAQDFGRILAAYRTDSTSQREKLLEALRETTFVMSIDAADDQKYIDKPEEVYLATDRLKQLFAGVADVMIVDDTYGCLQGQQARELLEACRVVRYPRPVPVANSLSYQERLELRKEGRCTQEYPVEDNSLLGLSKLIALLPRLSIDERRLRARLLWEGLSDLVERRGRSVFEGTYEWFYYVKLKATFPAAFVRQLKESAWIPDSNGDLKAPSAIVFESLGWDPNPFLQATFQFKPPLFDQLAREAGIDPEAINLLKRLGITDVAQLTARLGISESAIKPTESSMPIRDVDDDEDDSDVYDEADDLYGDDMPAIPDGTYDPEGDDDIASGGGGSGARARNGDRRSASAAKNRAGGENKSGSNGKRAAGAKGSRPFISYIGAVPEEEEADPDGLDHAARMQIEAAAIRHILSVEKQLKQMPDGNPGYDLLERDVKGQALRWVEVKAMTGSLLDRPVGLSHTQFEYAQKKGNAYWLYIVEYASDAKRSRIVRIQNPAGHASKFLFDYGWLNIAQMKAPVTY